MKKSILKLSATLTPFALIGLGSFGLAAINSAKPSDAKLVKHEGESAQENQSNLLDTARRWRNSNFTSASIEGTNPGALVLTGKKSISRIDLYGNVVWTFDPASSDLGEKVGYYDANNEFKQFTGTVPFQVSDLSSKTVVEAIQDQQDPNAFYLLLIPDVAVAQQQETKDHTFENYYVPDTPVSAGGEEDSETAEGAGGGAAPAPAAVASTGGGVPGARSSVKLVDGEGTATGSNGMAETVIDYETGNSIPKPKQLKESSESIESINEGKSYSSINSDKKLQGVIVKVNENLFNKSTPFLVENMSFIKPKDMVDNYPSNWKKTTENNKYTNVVKFYNQANPSYEADRGYFNAKYYPKRLETQKDTPLVDSSFSPNEHPEWFDEQKNFVMPWMQYITNLGGLYAKNNTVYLFGGNGTWVNNESALSIGVFRTKFGSSSTEAPGTSKTVGYPYAILLSSISIQKANLAQFVPGVAGLGQDLGYHYVPRLAVGGVSSPKSAGGNIFIGSTITWGTNGGTILDTKWHTPSVIEDATRTDKTTTVSNETIPKRWSNLYDYNSTSSASLLSKPAGGNTKQVESLFSTALKLDALNALPDQFDEQNKVVFTYAMLDGRQWSLGSWKDSTWFVSDNINSFNYNTQNQLANGGENRNPRNILNALTTARGFDRRSIGNVVYTYSSTDQSLTYYYQVGATITTWPEIKANYKNNANINFYHLNKSDFGSTTNDQNGDQSKLNSAYNTSAADTWYNGSIYVKKSKFTPSSQGYTWKDFKGLTTTSSKAVISNWTKAGYSIRPEGDTSFNVSKISFDRSITAAVEVSALDSYYVQLEGSKSLNSVSRKSSTTNALSLSADTIKNPLNNRNEVIGQGNFISKDNIPSSFFENKINDIIVKDSDGSEVLNSKYINSIYSYTPPADNKDIKLRLLVVDRSKATNDFIKLLPQVLVDGEYVPVPQANSVFVSDREFTGFNALPGYILPVAISIPIIIIALALALGLGVGIPMSQNRKMLKQGFAISNKKVDILTTAVGSVFKQIINRTSVSNIKKSPQMLQSAKKPAAKPAASGAKPAAPAAKPAGPAKPTGPAKPAAPKPKAPAK
ncbi:adhesin P1 [Mycoplasma bradburyae]|uniref:Adhesin P1 n=1 Tax=Mycoplasma bradburyae TaxID=2963128 RepID=A0ABT5GB72_9MOLU|nr:adhesin P1 [Mycoplasma bradburyae]MDC4182143.1 adhesin P1 [Mycoplasma bradburyae]UTS70288.1 adhesin P1 [Mycoplasma bradburyae]